MSFGEAFMPKTSLQRCVWNHYFRRLVAYFEPLQLIDVHFLLNLEREISPNVQRSGGKPFKRRSSVLCLEEHTLLSKQVQQTFGQPHKAASHVENQSHSAPTIIRPFQSLIWMWWPTSSTVRTWTVKPIRSWTDPQPRSLRFTKLAKTRKRKRRRDRLVIQTRPLAEKDAFNF